MKTRGSTGASAVRTADELTLNKDVFDSKHLHVCCLPFLHSAHVWGLVMTQGPVLTRQDGNLWRHRLGQIRSYVHIFIWCFTWGGSHCRAPMDCSMFFSSPLSCKSATSLPPPTHLSPMNTRGTCIHVWRQDKWIKSSGVQSLHLNWDPHFQWSRARSTRQ